MNENNSIAISIVIPIYNVEEYLAECLESCVNQTLKNIEIICVNDCTLDNSRAIAEEFAKRDKRVTLIDHEKNMGLGAARNTGVVYAKGEYVWFVDSDDYIAENACQILYDTAKEHDVDILTFNAINFEDLANGDKKFLQSPYYCDFPKNTVLNIKENFHLLNLYFPMPAWCYITKLSYLKQFKFRANCFYEDTDFTPIIFTECKKLYSLCYTAYNRRLRDGSIMRSEITEKKTNDKFSVCESLLCYAQKNNLPNEHFIVKFVKNFFIASYRLFLDNKEIISLDLENRVLHLGRKIFENIFLNIDTIILYGAGKRAIFILNLLKFLFKKEFFITVTEKESQFDEFCGLKIHELKELSCDFKDKNVCVLVTTAEPLATTMLEYAKKQGFANVYTFMF